MLISAYIERSDIGPNDCLVISKRSWINLSKLILADNQIGSEGCEYIVKANWPNLKIISLCNLSIIYTITKSVVKDANISNKHSGPNSIIW